MPIQSIQIPAGTVLAGYRIESELGRGNNGVVYLARQESLEREVALKILLPELAAEPGYVASFLHEARLAARLDHPNIVQAYDAGPTPEGYYYFAMELVIGPSLEDIRRNFPEKLTFDLIFRLSIQLADALEYAWSTHRMTHGDIKPGNLLISQETGGLKLADLGLARVSGSRAGDDIMATPLYAAPELIRGENGEFGVKSDLYSFGVMLYELLCGTPPFTGSPEKVLEQHLYATPQPLLTRNPDLDPKLVAFVEQLMDKDPAGRPGSWLEVREFFSSMLSAPRDNSNEAIRAILSAERRRRSLRAIGVWLIFLLILAILGAVIFLVFRLQQLEPEPITASPIPELSARSNMVAPRPAMREDIPELAVRYSSNPAAPVPDKVPVDTEKKNDTSRGEFPPSVTQQKEWRILSALPQGRRRGGFRGLFNPPVDEQILEAENRRFQRLFGAFQSKFPSSWLERAFLVVDESHRLLLQLHQFDMTLKRVDRIEIEPAGNGRARWCSNGPVSGTLRIQSNAQPIWIAYALGEGLFEANFRRLELPEEFRQEFAEAYQFFIEQRLPGKSAPNPKNRVLLHCNHSLPVFALMLQKTAMLKQLSRYSNR